MQSAELRERFLSFFEARGHRRVPSDSLIPSGDPTVLFTSAGMNQFKDYFLGRRMDLARAATCQKCLRTGDLDKVGKTPSHHSFFEMLGNFSFGDYFKGEAIQWAWEFLTGTLDYAGRRPSDIKDRCLALPAKRLWVSVYEDDEEAFRLWRRLGVPNERIKRFGQAQNFWPANAPTAGPNGPCGPCSEIYYDADGKVRPEESVEVWNLVFTQYDRQPDGTLNALPRPNIDTGMGLERLARVEQGVETDYETDLFAPIVRRISEWLIIPPSREEVGTVWTVADHLRAVVFLLAENLIPSNEERGYVLRMLIRRAHWHFGRLLWNRQSRAGGKSEYLEPFLSRMADSVAETYKPVYPEVQRQSDFIRKTLLTEEKRFAETLDAGNEQIIAEIDRLRQRGLKQISGDFAFKMKDTYGYPFELLADIASRNGLEVDTRAFEQRLVEQQERSRTRSQFGERVFVTDALEVRKAVKDLPPKDDQFIGYESLEAEAVIKGLWNGSQWVSSVTAGQSVGIVLDHSPFYGEAGGQAGDAGSIDAPKGAADVAQTTWVDDVLVHHVTVRQGTLSAQDPVRARVDPERRLKVARSHTAAHLLHWALRKALGPETVQAGSYVEAERVRFDFSSLSALREEQRHEVEALVNSRVRLADEVRASHMRLEEAKRSGALALFGEKYGTTVRVVTIGDYSKELCGGTHLPHTGFVGTFLLVGESSIAAGTRRVEALVGEAAARQQHEHQRLLHEVARRLSRPAQDVVAGLEELLDQLKRAERDRKALQAELAKVEAQRLIAEGKTINGVTFVTATVKHADRELLATMADAVTRSLSGEGVVCLASGDQPVTVVMATTAGLVERQAVHAGEMLKAIAPLIKGSGGGRPDFAQGGGKDPSGIPAAWRRAEELVREALERS